MQSQSLVIYVLNNKLLSFLPSQQINYMLFNVQRFMSIVFFLLRNILTMAWGLLSILAAIYFLLNNQAELTHTDLLGMAVIAGAFLLRYWEITIGNK